MSVVALKDHRPYRMKLLNRFQRMSPNELRTQAKWWKDRDNEVWLVIATEMARRK